MGVIWIALSLVLASLAILRCLGYGGVWGKEMRFKNWNMIQSFG